MWFAWNIPFEIFTCEDCRRNGKSQLLFKKKYDCKVIGSKKQLNVIYKWKIPARYRNLDLSSPFLETPLSRTFPCSNMSGYCCICLEIEVVAYHECECVPEISFFLRFIWLRSIFITLFINYHFSREKNHKSMRKNKSLTCTVLKVILM